MKELETTSSDHEKNFNERASTIHWSMVEELEPGYWDQKEIQHLRGQEFLHKPIETLEKIEKLDRQGIARRKFLTVMGASMAMAGLSCARRPVNKIIPYVIKPEYVTEGVATWYASTHPESGEGILIKNREGRPIKLEGNPDHPVNQGALSVRTQASILELYDPDRLKGPMTVKGGSVSMSSWEEVDEKIGSALKDASSESGSIRILSSNLFGLTYRQIVSDFLRSYGQSGANFVTYDPISFSSTADDISSGQEVCYGKASVPRYRFEDAEIIVSFGADFLGHWPNHTEAARNWAKNRKLQDENHSIAKMSKVICFEGGYSRTGANADERFPVAPEDELKVALAVLHELIVNQRKSAYSSDSRLTGILSAFSPEDVARSVGGGLTASKIKEIASSLWEAKGRGLVLAGGLEVRHQHSSQLQVAVNLLNTVLGNEGSTVDGSTHADTVASSYADFKSLVDDMKAGKVKVLLIHRANAAYSYPDFVSALKNVKTVVNVSEHFNETAAVSQFALGDHHFLENWGDASARSGVTSIQQPALAPLHNTRAFEDSLIQWVKKSGAQASGKIGDFDSWHDYLKGAWQVRSRRGEATFESYWNAFLGKGVEGSSSGRGSARAFRATAVKLLNDVSSLAAKDGIKLAMYVNDAMGAGDSANNAWLQEVPDSLSTVTWDNYLNVSPKLAAKMHLKTSDVVALKAPNGAIEVPVYVQPGVQEDTVTLAVGFGRTKSGRVGTGVGVNAFVLARLENGRWDFSGIPVSLTKTGRIHELAATQGHNQTEGRPLVNDISLEDYKKNPATENHTDPHLRMNPIRTIWKKHEYKGYKWGMAIDLNSCTGCNACVVACQAENNIPTVGRDGVLVSREMHWLRIDRYYAGSPDNPKAVFQPMLCQHCENASCETVCPVLATVHSDEGLNQMVYNRCVGTRYCQNNCPYKVRRFNFFDYWKNYETPMNLSWNPDVTVRSRGVMEKCTFCVQRINKARDTAKDEGRRIRDGDIVTACEQTCASNAIVFGDLNDHNSRVFKLAQEQRAFRSLEVYNNVPRVSYMTKVRNGDAEPHLNSRTHKGASDEQHH